MAVKARATVTISRIIDISAITRYYMLQSSTATAPAKPTTNPPSSSWTKTEPSYTTGSTNTLYFVDCTEFTNGTFKYSEVSKSSSYEAAKAAYNKAAAVETRVTNAETAIDQNKEAIALRATKTEVTEVKNQVISRGENLVTNGTALLGTNYNFTGFTYDGRNAYYSGGSFKTTAQQVLQLTDEYIPVDVSCEYQLSYWIKTDKSNAVYYDLLNMYDIDRFAIVADHVMWQAGSTTTLAQELKNGDTVVYLTDVSGFKTNISSGYFGFIFWNYTNSQGYTYPVETYSRNVWRSLWADSSAIDATNNTITLKSAWTHGTFPAGTSVSQNSSGGTYTYLNNYNVPADTWTQKTGVISGIAKNTSGGGFREGTAFVRVGWLIDYSKSGATTRICNVNLTKNADRTELNDAKSSITALSKTVTDFYTTLQINSDSISASVDKLETTVTEDINGLRDDIQTVRNKVDLQLTEDEVNIQIDKKLQNGVNKVETSTGFKFDEDGLNISKSGSITNTQITENGMSVKNTETNEDMLTADKDGVDAKNLRASTYLIIGGRSRFENYGAYRTGCFWIGPSSGLTYPVTNPTVAVEELTAQNNELKTALQTISDELDNVT